MALTPEGTPYVESSDLVANYPAASLALANRVDLVGVLPFANAAARTTAIPTPTDGQYSYLQDTNATEFWNGSAWIAAGVAPGLVRVATQSFSAVSSVSLNGVFTSAYQNYRIMCNGDKAGSAEVHLRVRASSTDATGANYVRQHILSNGTNLTSFRSTTDNVMRITGVGNTGIFSFGLDIFDPFAAAKTLFLSDAQDVDTGYYQAGRHDLTNSYDGFTLFPSSSTFTGTIRVYGYANS